MVRGLSGEGRVRFTDKIKDALLGRPAHLPRCHLHPTELLVDGLADGGQVMPSSLCQQCNPLKCVDVVRGLYRPIATWADPEA
jgi:hypothetical protein